MEPAARAAGRAVPGVPALTTVADVLHWGSREGIVRSTARPLVLALVLAAFAGCGGSSSPTAVSDPSVVVVESESLVQVSSDACHVQGTVVNTSDTATFKIVLRWQALDASDKVLGTTRVDLDRLLPGERRPYDATGFASNDQGLFPCSKITRFERIETTVTPA